MNKKEQNTDHTKNDQYNKEPTKLKEKKIIVLTSSFPRFLGDVSGNFVFELASKLSKKDYQILILTCHKTGLDYYEEIDQLKIVRFPYFFPISFQAFSGGGFVFTANQSPLAKVQIPCFFFSELFHSIKILNKEKYDLIHSHWLLPQGLVGAILKRIFRMPHILTIHAADVFLLDKLPFNQKIVDFIILNTDKIFVVSNYVYNTLANYSSPQIKSLLKNKTIILPMGINGKDFDFHEEKEVIKERLDLKNKYVILYIGRLTEKKGIEYLIEAMKINYNYRKEDILVICGDGPSKGTLIKKVDAEDISENVQFKGYITNQMKKDYLFIADILIVPSIILDSGETEGLPVVILEGLAAGKSIIASNVSGASDAISDGYNGCLVDQKRPDQIADKIIFLLENPEKKKEIEMNARKSSLKYDWDNIANEYANVINGLLKK